MVHAYPACGPWRILLTEDNATIRLVTTAMLLRMGHSVAVAENGEDAVAAVVRDHFDIILMDVMMPRMDGIAATRAIRALPGEAGRLPIIGVTANASPGDRVACIAAGMNGFAQKPVTASILQSHIAALLN